MVLENSYFENVNDPYYPDTRRRSCARAAASSSTAPARSRPTGSAFTPSSFYAYTLDPAARRAGAAPQYAGPQANIGL